MPPNPRFRCPTPTVHDDGSPIPAEWGLRCRTCGYELTGLSTRRCPECGRTFNPHEIWVANKRKQAGADYHTPAYVVYGAMLMVLLLCLPVILANPVIILPLAALPLYEGAAALMKRNAAEIRPIMVALAVIASIVVWAW